VVRRDARLREAASYGQTIADYAFESTGAADYHQLSGWIADKLASMPSVPLLDDAIGCLDGQGHDIADHDLHPHGASDDTACPAPSTPSVQVAVGHHNSPEVKPISRAEDVARRAQEFLRKITLGRTESQGAPLLPGPTPTATQAHVPSTHLIKDTTLTLIDEPRPTHVHPSAEALLGVRETSQGVLFVQPMTIGRVVALAAEFNNWSTTSNTFKPNHELGVLELCIKLPPGKLLYRLVVDGTWTADPHNSNRETNQSGDTKSVFVIGPQERDQQPAADRQAAGVSAR